MGSMVSASGGTLKPTEQLHQQRQQATQADRESNSHAHVVKRCAAPAMDRRPFRRSLPGWTVWLDEGLTLSQAFAVACATTPYLRQPITKTNSQETTRRTGNNNEVTSMRLLRRRSPSSPLPAGLTPRCIRQSNVYIKQEKLLSRLSRIFSPEHSDVPIPC